MTTSDDVEIDFEVEDENVAAIKREALVIQKGDGYEDECKFYPHI